MGSLIMCSINLYGYVRINDNDNDNDDTFIEHKYRLQMKIYI